MEKKSLINIIYTIIYQLLLVVLPIVTTPYVSRILGVEGIGKLSYVSTVVSYFVMFEQFGLDLYGRKEIACVKDDLEKRTLLIVQLFVLRVILFSIALIAYIIFIANFKTTGFLPWIYGGSLFATLFDITWVFQGIGEYRIITERNIVVRIVCLLAIFSLVRSEKDIYLYAFISVVSSVASQLILIPRLRKVIGRVSWKWMGMRRHIWISWLMFIPTIFAALYGKVDMLMLGYLTTYFEVGIYAQAEKIINMLSQLITPISLVLMPLIAEKMAHGIEKEALIKIFSDNSQVIWLVGLPISLGIMGTAKVFTNIFFGAGYEKVENLLYILAPTIVIIGFDNLYGAQFLVASGLQKEFNISVISASILNFLLNLLIINKMGAVGAAITTLITEIVMLAVQVWYVSKYIRFHVSPKLYYLLGGMLMFVVVKLEDVFAEPRIGVLIGQIITGGMVYLIVLLLNKDCYMMWIIRKVRIRLVKMIKKER